MLDIQLLRAVTSCQPSIALTMPGSAQNYRKSINMSPHTVEFEQMAGAIGMAAHQDIVETSLIGGNVLHFTT